MDVFSAARVDALAGSNNQDLNLLETASHDGALFDASQYAFFGKDVAEEVELGGLDGESDYVPSVEFKEDPSVEFKEDEFFLNAEEAEDVRSFSEIDDLTTTFLKLNKTVGGPRNAGVIGDRVSRENSSASEWSQRDDTPYWVEYQTCDSEGSQDGKRWSSHPYSSVTHLQESKPLYRTSSYPEQQRQLQHHLEHRSSEPVPNWFDQHFYDSETADDEKRWSSHPHSSISSNNEGPRPLYRTSSYPDKRQELPRFSSEPVLAPKSSFTSYPPPGGRSQQSSSNHSTGQLNIPYAGGAHIALSSQNRSHLFNSALHLGGSKYEPQFGGNLAQFNTGSPLNNRIQNQWVNQTGLYPGDNSNLLNNMLQQQLYHNNGSVSPHLLTQLQQQPHRLHHPVQQSAALMSGLQPHLFNRHLLPGSSIGRKYEHVHGFGDIREHRQKSTRRHRFSQQGSNATSEKSDSCSIQFRSKYMTSEEIESILKMQLAVTHCNDPYIDDYYHQACLAKKPSGAKFKFSFCPAKIKDLSSRSRANSEPHRFLQVDTLGRISYLPIRQPRPLLEDDPPNSSASGGSERNISEKPLEGEPLFAARVTIEDGLCLLLDVDDIDRFLKCNLLQDGGTQFLRRRSVLLEGLATSLHLVDPLGKNGHKAGLAAKDDLVFLRLASLSKGRKLLAKYLRLLVPGSELMRIACMAIFRHLRFLFGSIPSDSAAAETTSGLAMVVCQCVQGMDLGSLGACLAAVVCSSEQPPLRPIGSSAGDGASLVLVSVLEGATELLTDHQAASNNKLGNRSFWQASFDEFFDLLTKYCMNKYQNIIQSLLTQGAQNVPAIRSDAAKSVSKEMPVELLRASLPHTNDRQRKLLLDFAQRSAPVVGFNNYAGRSTSRVNSETVIS